MSKKHDNNYNKTEKYLREEESTQKQVGGQTNQLSNKIGQADVQKDQGSHKKEQHGQEQQKQSKKSDFRNKN